MLKLFSVLFYLIILFIKNDTIAFNNTENDTKNDPKNDDYYIGFRHVRIFDYCYINQYEIKIVDDDNNIVINHIDSFNINCFDDYLELSNISMALLLNPKNQKYYLHVCAFYESRRQCLCSKLNDNYTFEPEFTYNTIYRKERIDPRGPVVTQHICRIDNDFNASYIYAIPNDISGKYSSFEAYNGSLYSRNYKKRQNSFSNSFEFDFNNIGIHSLNNNDYAIKDNGEEIKKISLSINFDYIFNDQNYSDSIVLPKKPKTNETNICPYVKQMDNGDINLDYREYIKLPLMSICKWAYHKNAKYSLYPIEYVSWANIEQNIDENKEIFLSFIEIESEKEILLLCKLETECDYPENEEKYFTENITNEILLLYSQSFPLNRKMFDKNDINELGYICTDHYGRTYKLHKGIDCITIQHNDPPIIDVIMTYDDFLNAFKSSIFEDTDPYYHHRDDDDKKKYLGTNFYDLLLFNEYTGTICYYYGDQKINSFVKCHYLPSITVNKPWHKIQNGEYFCPVQEKEELKASRISDHHAEFAHGDVLNVTLKQHFFYVSEYCYARARFSTLPDKNDGISTEAHFKYEHVKNVIKDRIIDLSAEVVSFKPLNNVYRDTCPWYPNYPVYELYYKIKSKDFLKKLISTLEEAATHQLFSKCVNQLVVSSKERQHKCFRYYEQVNGKWEMFWLTKSIFSSIIAKSERKYFPNDGSTCKLLYMDIDKHLKNDQPYKNCNNTVLNSTVDVFRKRRVAYACYNFQDFYDYHGMNRQPSSVIETKCNIANKTVTGHFVFCIVSKNVINGNETYKYNHIDGESVKYLNIDPYKCMKTSELDLEGNGCFLENTSNKTTYTCCCHANKENPCNTKMMVDIYHQMNDDSLSAGWCSFDSITNQEVMNQCNKLSIPRNLKCFAEFDIVEKEGKQDIYPKLVLEGCYTREWYLRDNKNETLKGFINPIYQPFCEESSSDNKKNGFVSKFKDCFVGMINEKSHDHYNTRIIICCKPSQFKDAKLFVETKKFRTIGHHDDGEEEHHHHHHHNHDSSSSHSGHHHEDDDNDFPSSHSGHHHEDDDNDFPSSHSGHHHEDDDNDFPSSHSGHHHDDDDKDSPSPHSGHHHNDNNAQIKN